MSPHETLPRTPYFYSGKRDPLEDRLRALTYADPAPPRTERVVLVVPPSPQLPTPGREFLITGPFEGLTAIATLVKRMGFPLEVVDCRSAEDPAAHALEKARGASMAAFATYCDSFVFLEEATRALRAASPETLVVLGGPLVSSLPETVLAHTAADCAILGEGELTLMELLERVFTEKTRDFRELKGLAYRDGGRTVVNAPRPQIKNLDNLPFLDYTVWPSYESIVKHGQIMISSTRGCSQECSFCFKTIPALRLKSLGRFEEEVAFLRSTTGFTYTWLNDLTFNVLESRAAALAHVMGRHGVRYHVFARVKNVSAGLVRALKETGCLGIWFGIESYSREVLDLNRKQISLEDIDRAVALAAEGGLGVRGLFIVGLPGETERSLAAMVEYIGRSEFLPLVKYLVPFPGTALFECARAEGKIGDPAAFLRLLAERKVRDHDDEIVNLTGLDDGVLREYFHRIWTLTKERERRFDGA